MTTEREVLDDERGEPLASAVVVGDGPLRQLGAVWFAPGADVHELGPPLLELVRSRASATGARVLRADVPSGDPVLLALTAGTRVLGRSMTRPVDPAAALPPALGWRAMTRDEFAPWLEAQTDSYATAGLLRSGGDRAAALERSRHDFAEILPQGLDTPGTSLVVLLVEGERVGHLWLTHHRDGAETFGYDLEIVPDRRREGWGRAAIALASRLAARVGDTTLGLHVFGDNVGALQLYESEGFTVRSTSHDLLADR